MKVEISRFSDGRLMVLTKHPKNDTNIRIGCDEISICTRLEDNALEKDVLEAVDLWNHLPRDPTDHDVLIKEIYARARLSKTLGKGNPNGDF